MSSKKAEARERVKAMREEQARKERQRERMLRFGIAGAVIAAVAIIAVAVTASRGGDDGPVALPDTVSEEGGGVTFGQAEAPVEVDVWLDFLCPHCKEFEDANGATIDELVAAGEAKVTYHPVTYTGRNYSARANNAFACAVDAGEGEAYFKALFVSPQQWTDNALVELGESVGLEGDFESCVRDDTYDDWSGSVTDAATASGDITGTPTVHVNGEVLEDWTPEGIRNAVQTAASGGSTTPTEGATGEATPAPSATS
jgi:protein-disulfide isomerase